MEAEHSIHIEQHPDEPPFSCYDSSESYDEDTDQDRLNRLSSTSTLIGSPSSSRLHHHSPSSSMSSSCGSSSSTLSSTTEILMSNNTKTTSSRHRRQQQQQHQQGFLYRFMHSEAGRLACAFFYFGFVCIGMAFCNQLSDHRWIQTGYTEVLLRDRGFDVIAAQSDISPANTFVMTSVVFTVLGVGLICPDWTTRTMALRRVMWVIGTLSVFRAMTLSVTTLPTPKAECRPSLKTGFWDMFIVALQMIPGTVEACTDDIFSGHTVFMVSCAIQWRLYCKNKWITYFSYLYISIGLYFVVATRLHYTVDVVLAVFITYAAWSLYISLIDVVMEQEYFGIKEHAEKYSAFDQILNEYEMLNEQQQQEQILLERTDSNEESAPLAATTTTSTTAKKSLASEAKWQNHRRQLEHMMNRLRGPRIGYARGEHDRVAFVPMQYNLGLIGLIRWCDGLDLRMRPAEPNNRHSANGSGHGSVRGPARWNDLVVRYRIEKETSGSSPNALYRHRAEDYDYDDEEEEEEDEEDEHDQDNGLEMAEAGRRGPHKREMTQIYSRRIVDGMTLQGVQICNYEEEVQQQQQQQQQQMDQQWRSLPLRKASRRSRMPNAKSSTKTGTKDRSKKFRLAKMGLIILLNLLLLVVVVRYVQDKSSIAAVSSSSPTLSSMDSVRSPDSLETSGNTIPSNFPAQTHGAPSSSP
ncbi:hypothetical protein EMPS_08905 [Entomortierella parvispora]|uniref:Sphingomyelin synthase-like domain-containing protein n=1 Tax=Entomortierella parvispora TaxID=205924 RepID=A0A9P3HH89_9FUNG|nr:hypothetical protein EMPS_08905 [Entomortierella parvispora]